MAVNLGSTIKDFLEAINTNSTDTQEIINGTKRIKKLKLGSEDTENGAEIVIEETVETESQLPVIKQQATGYLLRTGVIDELGVRHKETGMTSMSGRLSLFSSQEERDTNGLLTEKLSATVSVNENGTVNLNSKDTVHNKESNILLRDGKITFSATDGIEGLPTAEIDTSKFVTTDTEQTITGKKSFDKVIKVNDQIQIGDHGRITNYSGDSTYTEIQDDSELWLISENVDGELSYIDVFPNKIDYFSSKHNFRGNVDFTNATVTGLDLSGGTLAIEVEELPTENIDDSKIYILNEIKNAEVYYFDGEKYCTLSAVILDVVGVTPTINHYVVNELPTNAEITDLQTFSVVNCYIFDNVSYVYGSVLGSDNMWLPVNFIFEQMGNPTENKGRVYDLTNASVEVGLYVYYEEFRKFYLYSDSEWKEIGGSISDKYILRLSGNNGVLSDEQYQGLVDNFPNTTIIVTEGEETIVYNTIATAKGVYMATFSAGTISQNLYIFANKNWSYLRENLPSGGSIDTTADITWDGAHKFNGNVQFYADCAMDYINCDTQANFNGEAYFWGAVDFTNATEIKGLPSGGGLDIPSEVISYDSTNNSLSFNTKTLNFNASDSIRIENNLNWFYFEDTEQQSAFGLELNDQNVMFNIFYNKENGTSSFYCDANIIDFTNATEVKVNGLTLNGLTLNGALTLANNGEISDSEEQLQIYKTSPPLVHRYN